MSLLGRIKGRALETVLDEQRQKNWVESGFDLAIKNSRALLPDDWTESELKALRDAAEHGLQKLEQHKGAVVKWGEQGLKSTLTLVAIGDYDEASKHAALVTLRESGSWDDVSSAILGTAAAGNQAKRDLDATREEILAVLKDIGIGGAKAILPLLIAAISEATRGLPSASYSSPRAVALRYRRLGRRRSHGLLLPERHNPPPGQLLQDDDVRGAALACAAGR